jgi:hypothetical protein
LPSKSSDRLPEDRVDGEEDGDDGEDGEEPADKKDSVVLAGRILVDIITIGYFCSPLGTANDAARVPTRSASEKRRRRSLLLPVRARRRRDAERSPIQSLARKGRQKEKAGPPLCPGMSESDLSISDRLVVLIVLVDLRRALEGQRQIGSGRDCEAEAARGAAATAGRQSSDSHCHLSEDITASSF